MFQQPQKMRISRKEFYDKVWSKPAKTLASEFGISDVMIAKICKKHQIPKPGLGYWSRFENGYKDPVSPLPQISDRRLDQIEFTQNAGDSYKFELSDATNDLVLREEIPGFEVEIPKRVSNRSTFESQIRVSKENSDRAVRIFAALMSAFKKRDFRLGTDDKGLPTVTIQGAEVSFKLQERYQQKRVKSLDEIQDRNLRKRHEFMFQPGQMILLPTGQLYFQIESYTDIRCKKHWSDKDSLPLEDQLKEFVKGLIVASEGVRRHDERIKAMHRQWDLERKQARQKEEERQAKKARMEAIKKLANDSINHQAVVKLKMEIEKLSTSEAPTPEALELLKWVDEYLSAGNPVEQFMSTTIKPLLPSVPQK